MFSEATFCATARVVTLVEELKVKLVRRPRSPEAQDVDGGGAVARHQGRARLAKQPLAREPAHAQPAGRIGRRLGVAAEAYFDHVVRADELPWIAITQPDIRLLDLIAVDKALLKDAELVPDAVPHGGQIEGSQ